MTRIQKGYDRQIEIDSIAIFYFISPVVYCFQINNGNHGLFQIDTLQRC